MVPKTISAIATRAISERLRTTPPPQVKHFPRKGLITFSDCNKQDPATMIQPALGLEQAIIQMKKPALNYRRQIDGRITAWYEPSVAPDIMQPGAVNPAKTNSNSGRVM